MINFVTDVIAIVAIVVTVATVIISKRENKSLATVFHAEVAELRQWVGELTGKESAQPSSTTQVTNNSGKTTS